MTNDIKIGILERAILLLITILLICICGTCFISLFMLTADMTNQKYDYCKASLQQVGCKELQEQKQIQHKPY